jgi:predicted methyltransferase
MDFDFLLQVIDRYPIDVEIKHGSVPFVPKVIIFTSTTPIDSLYPYLRPEQATELTRRFTSVITEPPYTIPDISLDDPESGDSQ